MPPLPCLAPPPPTFHDVDCFCSFINKVETLDVKTRVALLTSPLLRAGLSPSKLTLDWALDKLLLAH